MFTYILYIKLPCLCNLVLLALFNKFKFVYHVFTISEDLIFQKMKNLILMGTKRWMSTCNEDHCPNPPFYLRRLIYVKEKLYRMGSLHSSF